MFERLKRKLKRQEVPVKRTRIVKTVYQVEIPLEEREYVKEEGGAFIVAGSTYRRGIFYSSPYGSMHKGGYYERAIAVDGPQKGRELYPGVDYEKTEEGIQLKRKDVVVKEELPEYDSY